MIIAHVMMARIRQAQGDLPGAEDSFRSAEGILHSRQIRSTGAEWLEMGQAWFWLAQGKVEACEHWLHKKGISLTDPATHGDGEMRLIVGRILLAQQNPDAAAGVNPCLAET